MEQKSNPFSAPGPQPDAAQMQQALQGLLAHSVDSDAGMLSAFAQLQQRRAERSDALGKALKKKAGSDNPDVIAMQNMAGALSQIKEQTDRQAARANRWTTPKANEWTVFGTVTDVQGKSAAGVTVRVFDRDRKYDDLLGETVTDENGDFSVLYHERDFAEPGEKLPDLYVMVSDAAGKSLYSSRDTVRFEAGRSEYFAIQLGKRGRAAANPGARAGKN